ncbi:MAG: UDP-N-acetylmuramoyl-tripeptide--D-alanyl-D-alanine ligase [Patescibacteria group bacterium]
MFRLFPLKVLFYHLYLLQLEEYSINRYLKLIVKTKGVPSGSTRKQVEWTQKLTLVFFVAFTLQLLTSILLGIFIYKQLSFDSVTALSLLLLFSFLFLCYFFFLFLVLSLLIITPLDSYLKKRILQDAKAKMKQFPDIKIIGIAGSYGKTTMKELLAAVLSQKFKVVKTPKNINTPLGISRTILKEISAETEYFIVEMGEYTKGDIKDLCKITTPDIAIVTGINEAHLERMGGIHTTIETIFEVVAHMKESGVVLLNGDDHYVKDNYQKYIQQQQVIIYGSDKKIDDIEIKDVEFEKDASGITFSVHQRGLDLGRLKIAVLGEYIVADALGAIKLAEKLGLSIKQISDGIAAMKPIAHRLEPIYNKNTKILVIDDSYNGNPRGVEEAINVLSKFDQQRRIYLTPGLAESAEKAREIHYNIGKQLAKVAGLVILIRNSVTPFIAEGLTQNGFDTENIVWFDTAKEAHSQLGKLLRPYDVILFQNDWPDNYV